MSHELARAEAFPIHSMDDLARLSEMFAKSGYFTDAREAAQIGVKVMAGREMGFGPFASVNGVHIIQGKPAVGANLMAAAVKASGKYDYRVRQMDNDACKLEFFQGTESLGVSEFTRGDAKAAKTQNLDKFARNMLFARAMSNGVRWYCPDVFMGSSVYTPEELGAVVDGEGQVVQQADPAPALEPDTSRLDLDANAPGPDDPFEPTEEKPKQSSKKRRKAQPDDPITKESAARLADGLKGIGVTGDEQAQRVEQVTGRHVEEFTELTQAEATAVWLEANGGDPDRQEAEATA